MRVLFFGTAAFAIPTLQALADALTHDMIGVVTQPDRPQGRGGHVSQSPIKKTALDLGFSLWQPEKVRAKAFIAEVKSLEPDILVIAAFGQIIPQQLLDLPPYGGINVHGSLLPRWRGAAPIQYALMAGDTETGVTTMQMDAGLDTGDILLQKAMPLSDDDNYGTVEIALAEIGAPLLLETLARLEQGTCPRIPQNPEEVTLSPSLPSEFGLLDWALPAETLHNLVRGVTPRPGAFAFRQGKRVKILRTRYTPEALGEAGIVQKVDENGITVGTGLGTLLLCEVQPESRAKMAASAWARGVRLVPGQPFDGGVSPN